MQKLFIWLSLAMLSVSTGQLNAEESYGNPGDPVVAEVLGMQIRTKDPEEMQYVINQKLIQDYAQKQEERRFNSSSKLDRVLMSIQSSFNQNSIPWRPSTNLIFRRRVRANRIRKQLSKTNRLSPRHLSNNG